jgi:hypothetical protein
MEFRRTRWPVAQQVGEVSKSEGSMGQLESYVSIEDPCSNRVVSSRTGGGIGHGRGGRAVVKTCKGLVDVDHLELKDEVEIEVPIFESWQRPVVLPDRIKRLSRVQK